VYHETSIVTLRLAFWGSDCLYSETVLHALLHSAHQVTAVLLPASGFPGLPANLPIQVLLPQTAQVREYDAHALTVVSPFVQRSIVHTTWDKGVALYAVRDLTAQETIGTLRMARVDVACVACFPRRIPAALLHVPKRGFLNVHPSLLPEYRGPAPLFWQLHEGESHTGVTIHWMDAEFDTGPLADQRQVALADGISETDATSLMARAGARLLVEMLDHVAAGEIPYRKQPAGGAYQPYPRESDFTISSTWPARRVYNFMCGTAVWGFPFRLELEDETLLLSDAVSWSAHEVLPAPLLRQGDQVIIQCSPGTVRAHLA
jgi:methionyl-tRNA formyltransferase